MRFVVLRHEMPPEHERPSHWDLLIEVNETNALATWSLLRMLRDGEEAAAERLADHRRQYLDYEGPVSGNRGRVTRWDAGTCRLLEQTDQRWVVQLSGERLHGRLELARLSAGNSWTARWFPAGS